MNHGKKEKNARRSCRAAGVRDTVYPALYMGRLFTSRGAEITEEIMASKKKSKVVGKDDLRRLMKEKSSGIKSTTKRIDSPLAKYPFWRTKSREISYDITWAGCKHNIAHTLAVNKLKQQNKVDVSAVYHRQYACSLTPEAQFEQMISW